MNERWRDRAVGREKDPGPEEGRERTTRGTYGGLPPANPGSGDRGDPAVHAALVIRGHPSGSVVAQADDVRARLQLRNSTEAKSVPMTVPTGSGTTPGVRGVTVSFRTMPLWA